MKKQFKIFLSFIAVIAAFFISSCSLNVRPSSGNKIGRSEYYVENDRIYYDTGGDAKITGEYDGKLFDETGAVVADEELIQISAYTFYLVENKVQYGYQVINDHIYNFGQNGRMVTGKHTDGYRYETTGELIGNEIFITINNYTYYIVNNVVVKGLYVVGNSVYNFGTDGKMVKGVESNGYVFDLDGKLIGTNILITINNYTYYIINNVVVTGIQVIENGIYNFGLDGKMIKDAEFEGRKYGSDGRLVGTDIFITINHYTYYIINNIIVTGLQVIDGSVYNFGLDGKMIKNAEYEGHTFDGNGKLVGTKIFITINNYTYYIANNIVVTGIQVIDGNVYGFNKDGKMIKDGECEGYKFNADGKIIATNIFITINNYTYYIINNIIVTGLQLIDGDIYCFDTDGKMVKDAEYEDYRFDENGKLVGTNVFITVNNYTYYIINNIIVTGIQVIENNIYNFGLDGKMIKNQTIDGLTFGPNGYVEEEYKELVIDNVQYVIINNYIYQTIKISGKIFESDHTITDEDNEILSSVTCKVIINDYVYTVVSFEDGTFIFDNVPSTIVKLQFILEGYITSETIVDLSVDTTFRIVLDKKVSNVLTGRIVIADSDTNYSNNAPLVDALVEITRTSSTNVWNYSTHTDSNGNYTFKDLTAGVYKLVVSKEGYIEVSQTINVRANQVTVQNLTIEAISSTQVEDGYASGVITDSRTGRPVSGITVYIKAGINNITGETLMTLTTNSNGTYITEALTPGNYTAYIVDERTLDDEDYRYGSYSLTIKVLSNVTISNQNATISNSVGLEIDGFRVVLTWGATPSDLDSHLQVNQTNGKSYHVYYSNKTPVSNANLDVDDTSSYGPETITVSSIVDGVYHYYVHDYSNGSSTSSTALANSGATINVYFGSEATPAYTFNVPSGSGTYWHVFTYNSVTGEFTINNVITTSSSYN